MLIRIYELYWSLEYMSLNVCHNEDLTLLETVLIPHMVLQEMQDIKAFDGTYFNIGYFIPRLCKSILHLVWVVTSNQCTIESTILPDLSRQAFIEDVIEEKNHSYRIAHKSHLLTLVFVFINNTGLSRCKQQRTSQVVHKNMCSRIQGPLIFYKMCNLRVTISKPALGKGDMGPHDIYGQGVPGIWTRMTVGYVMLPSESRW